MFDAAYVQMDIPFCQRGELSSRDLPGKAGPGLIQNFQVLQTLKRPIAIMTYSLPRLPVQDVPTSEPSANTSQKHPQRKQLLRITSGTSAFQPT